MCIYIYIYIYIFRYSRSRVSPTVVGKSSAFTSTIYTADSTSCAGVERKGLTPIARWCPLIIRSCPVTMARGVCPLTVRRAHLIIKIYDLAVRRCVLIIRTCCIIIMTVVLRDKSGRLLDPSALAYYYDYWFTVTTRL